MKVEPKSLAYVHSLTPEKIQDVIDDLRLLQIGYRLYFAIDPHELSDFCFPINPESDRDVDIDTVADDQAALYYIFFTRKTPPILLHDYMGEIRGLALYLQHKMEGAFDQTSILNTLIQAGGLSDITRDRVEADEREVFKIVSKKFNIVLAVVMGIYSLGVQRFQSAYNRLLGTGLIPEDPVFRDSSQGYKPTDLVQQIFHYLSITQTSPSPFKEEQERTYRNFYNDAKAIDRLVHLNTRLQQRNWGPSENRRLVLYLSSADRTQKIFKHRMTPDRLPVVEGKPYSFNRDRSQIFIYLIHKSRTGDLAESIENLEKVKEGLKAIESLNRRIEYCSQCVLEGLTPASCDRLEVCQTEEIMYRAIQERRAEIRNLGLTSALDNYRRLLDAKPKGESQARLMNFFRQVFSSELIRDVAPEKMLRKQQLILVQSVTSALNSYARSYVEEEHLRAGRDSIVATSQYLPLKPQVDNALYSKILELILSFYKTPPQGDEEKIGIINEAYRLYCAIDAHTNDLDSEHELIRCLIYLAFPSNKGDRLAYEHATEMLAQNKIIQLKPYTEREYTYIQCWAGRRAKKFEATRDIASAAIRKWPTDPRFFHGRSLNALAWYEDEHAGGNKPKLLKRSIEDARQAVELYSHNLVMNRELVAVTYNTLAYAYALNAREKRDHPTVAATSIAEARTALDQLKTLAKRSKWSPNHPEYFHTEAFVEYQEFDYYKTRNDRSISELIDKLNSARREIGRALQISPSRGLYIQLKKDIDAALVEYGVAAL